MQDSPLARLRDTEAITANETAGGEIPARAQLELEELRNTVAAFYVATLMGAVAIGIVIGFLTGDFRLGGLFLAGDLLVRFILMVIVGKIWPDS